MIEVAVCILSFFKLIFFFILSLLHDLFWFLLFIVQALLLSSFTHTRAHTHMHSRDKTTRHAALPALLLLLPFLSRPPPLYLLPLSHTKLKAPPYTCISTYPFSPLLPLLHPLPSLLPRRRRRGCCCTLTPPPTATAAAATAAADIFLLLPCSQKRTRRGTYTVDIIFTHCL